MLVSGSRSNGKLEGSLLRESRCFKKIEESSGDLNRDIGKERGEELENFSWTRTISIPCK